MSLLQSFIASFHEIQKITKMTFNIPLSVFLLHFFIFTFVALLQTFERFYIYNNNQVIQMKNQEQSNLY
jgi:hypothetical protein